MRDCWKNIIEIYKIEIKDYIYHDHINWENDPKKF